MARETNRIESTKRKRTQRIKYGDPKLRLAIDPHVLQGLEDQGLVPRHVVDNGKGRIEKLKMRGYEFVRDPNIQLGEDDGNTDMGSAISRVCGTNKDGTPQRMYLMVQKKEYYEEDQALKEEINMRVDDAIRRGSPKGPNETTVNSEHGRTYVRSVEYKP